MAPVVVGTVPPQHMYGLETTIMLPLQQGWSLHAGHPILPADVHGDLAELRVPAWLMTTPVHLRAYVSRKTALPGIAHILSATMPLAYSLATKAEHLWDVPVQEIYGCTETGVIGSRRPTAGESWALCRSLRLRQDGDAAWVSEGHVGQPVRLPDRITLQSNDEFLLHGPNHDLVKVAGKRASLAALNAVLVRIEGVVDGTFYRPEDGRSDRLTAFVVAPGLRPSTILKALRSRIDPVFLPRPLHVVEALPRNSTGKLAREQLETFARAYRARRSAYG
jgi:acyl-coenzyme A synthetase/AMP-(fatty) acid ligase